MDKEVDIMLHPPPVNVISPKRPNISMLKMMIASNNLAQGIGNVFEDIIKQTCLSEAEFFEKIQVMEGDLGTCLNFESLQAQKKPTRHIIDNFNNCFCLLGAAHVLWNLAQSIYLLHYGNPKDSSDLGAWRILASLGIPSNCPVCKKDFTLMIANMQKIHKATILKFLLIIMRQDNELLSEEKLPLKSTCIAEIMDECYQEYFLPSALLKAKSLPRDLNSLLRLRDFATVFECNNAMTAGDVGPTKDDVSIDHCDPSSEDEESDEEDNPDKEDDMVAEEF
ncbi:hypothetical protein PCANC_28708 [Puccinia coronata f. sp. avenae]|uniref:DUF6589 domain-containing protein n=1 Tax=Puccinia coronata f. sp. avenae TaxID=200324 RepID=A0A2N5RZE4_9BASI|nr:hypothetical protein PCANC_28708 [Puccinia coronata f. sp. avenae]